MFRELVGAPKERVAKSRNNWSSTWLYTVEDSFRSKNFESKWYDKEPGGVGVFLYTVMKFLSFVFEL